MNFSSSHVPVIFAGNSISSLQAGTFVWWVVAKGTGTDLLVIYDEKISNMCL